jgi:long-subunit fatty acid transport protein
MPAAGAGWHFSPKLAFGFKLDTPYMRHLELPLESSSRFFGKAFDLKSMRGEIQAAYAITEAFSLGLSLGATRIDYASALSLRLPIYPSYSVDDDNPAAEALVETTVRQDGSVTAPTFAVGVRYAITSRWTFGGSFTSGAKGRPSLAASMAPEMDLYNTRGDSYPPPPLGSVDKVLELAPYMQPQPGVGDISMPYKIQAGVRHRLNQTTTWEFDVRYIGASAASLPTQPELYTPNGTAATLARDYVFRNGLAFSAMIEITVNKDWMARAGVSYDPDARDKTDIEPMLGGSRSAGFSLGFVRKALGGELSAGHQYRQTQDVIANNIAGSWSASGLRYTGTPTKVEGMGHLLSVGFKKSF